MQLIKTIRYLFEPKALVLMYHRIDDVSNDPWQLAVSPKNFEQQLQVLKNMGKLLPVKEMVKNLHQKSIAHRSICLTFDDGYNDNYLAAKPLLEKYQCAASFFIPTHYPGGDGQFWWDELEKIFLSYPKLPVKCSFTIGTTLIEYELENNGVLTNNQLIQHGLWAWPATPPTQRCEIYLAIWKLLKPLPFPALQNIIKEIKLWASFDQPADKKGFPMTHQQLKDISNHPLIDIGMHTVTHPALSSHAFQVQQAEINGSRHYLENLCNRQIDTIAYPYGDYNDITLSIAKELGLYAAFTTAEIILTNRTDPYQIGRFQVRNWNGDEFEHQISEWNNSSRYL